MPKHDNNVSHCKQCHSHFTMRIALLVAHMQVMHNWGGQERLTTNHSINDEAFHVVGVLLVGFVKVFLGVGQGG